MISKKHLITKLSIVGLLVVSSYSYAVANTLVYRSPVGGAKADEQSEVQKQKNIMEEERLMCLSQGKTIYERRRDIVTWDLDNPGPFYYNNSENIEDDTPEPMFGGEIYADFNYRNITSPLSEVRFSVLTNDNPKRYGYKTALNLRFGNEGDTSTYFGYTADIGDRLATNAGNALIVGEKVRSFETPPSKYYPEKGGANWNEYKVSIANSSSAFTVFEKYEEVEKDKNYDWCVENGYETAS